MRHTQGDWNFNPETGVIWDETGDVAIATIDRHVLSTDEERKANGHLIEAAPDLQEACDAVLSELEEIGDKYTDLRGKVMDAIKKSIGVKTCENSGEN